MSETPTTIWRSRVRAMTTGPDRSWSIRSLAEAAGVGRGALTRALQDDRPVSLDLAAAVDEVLARLPDSEAPRSEQAVGASRAVRFSRLVSSRVIRREPKPGDLYAVVAAATGVVRLDQAPDLEIARALAELVERRAGRWPELGEGMNGQG